MKDAKDHTALLFNVQRFSTEDGPGIRTTLFFKGCSLACPWCHNPEGMDDKPALVWYDARCIACRDSNEVCPKNALTLSEKGNLIDRSACDLCGDCVEECPAAALEIIGREYTLDGLAGLAMRDAVFYRSSGGGVTFSGGEPLAQAAFVEKLAARLKDAGVHLALDTTGVGPRAGVKRLRGLVDMVLLDVKLMDEKRHREIVGAPLESVLSCLDLISEVGVPLWVRTPVIPGMTDSDENILAIASHLKSHAPTLKRWDLLAFENTCRAKYRMLGLEYALDGVPLMPKRRMDELLDLAKKSGVNVARWSGPTRPEEEPGERNLAC